MDRAESLICGVTRRAWDSGVKVSQESAGNN